MNREDLKNYKYNQEWIKGRIDYIEDYKSKINKLTTTISDIPRGSKQIQDTEAEKVSKLMDSVNELLYKINKENDKQKLILKKLDEVDPLYRNILDKIYIQGKTLVTVASEMNYSYNRMKHLHGIALNKFDNTCKKEKLTPKSLE